MDYKSKEFHKGYKVYYPKTIKQFRGWLSKYGKIEKSVWIILFKKKSSAKSLTIGEIVNHSLCFGWVDSKTNSRDDDSYYVYISPRNPKSYWSAVNKSNIENLEKENLIEDAGYKLINLAKETGTWDALNDVDNLIIPQDLKQAFNKYKKAESHFINFNRSSKRGILEWIFTAKKEATRNARIQKTALFASQNKRVLFD